jgi:hypothetical protein
MSKISDNLKQVNADLRAAIEAEHLQVRTKLEELQAKIDSLGNVPDEEFDAELQNTRDIVTSIQNILEE